LGGRRPSITRPYLVFGRAHSMHYRSIHDAKTAFVFSKLSKWTRLVMRTGIEL